MGTRPRAWPYTNPRAALPAMVLAVTLSLALLTGCAGGPPHQGYTAIDERQLNGIVAGTSAAVLRALLGPPADTMLFRNLGEQVWSWRYTSLHGEAMMFNAHLDAQAQSVRYTSSTPEFVSSREGMN